ncbi:MAG: sugar ABC transporter substrate-binding protein [Bilifractor sp.]
MKKAIFAVTMAAAMAASLAGCGSTSTTSSTANSGGTSTSAASATSTTSTAATSSVASGSGAASGTTKDISQLKLAFIVGTENDEFYQRVEDGIKSECEAKGIPEPTLGDQELDGSKCTDLINTYVAANYDAIALSCNDPAGTVPAIEAAKQSGVDIFTFDCTLDDQYKDDYISFVGTDNKKGGELAGEYVVEHAPEGSKVGCITYASAQSTQDRQAGFEETVQKAIDGGKNLELIETQDANNDQQKAADIMQNLITQYGDDLSYVFVVGDPTGYGALSSIQAAGSNTKIVGFDAGKTALQYVADTENVGKTWVAEVAQDPEGIGSGIVDQIVDYYTNGKVDQQKNLIDPYVIDASNVADHLK